MKNLNVFTLLLILLLSGAIPTVHAQGVAIKSSGSNPDPSAMLDVSSTTKGLLVPRMTETEKNAIASPATGLLIYQTDGAGAGFWYFDGIEWHELGSAGATPCAGAPATPGPILGTSAITTNVVYSYMVAPVAGATTYTWNYTGSGAVISGTTNPVTIYFNTNATAGNLTVTASCGNGNSTSAPLSITTQSITFDYTGGMQTWTVPAGVTSVVADVYGGKGLGTAGGNGGQAKGSFTVTPGQVLNLFIDRYTASPTTVGCGWNPGGGASDIRIGGTAVSDRVIVAGGGGGEGWNLITNVAVQGGAGGGLIGGNASGSGAGSGGTQAAGGAGGTGANGNGGAGSLGQGGGGVSCSQSSGGGGGYYGGGGGGQEIGLFRGAGGGGSNYFAPSVTLISNLQGVHTSDYGKIILNY